MSTQGGIMSLKENNHQRMISIMFQMSMWHKEKYNLCINMWLWRGMQNQDTIRHSFCHIGKNQDHMH